MSVIKAGYRIVVDSFEGDEDYQCTKSVDGLNELEAKFHLELLNLLTDSCFATGYGNIHFSNSYDDPIRYKFDRECVAIVTNDDYKDVVDTQLDDSFLEVALDILNQYTSFDGGEYYTRQISKIVVEHVPEEIFLEEVTSKFLDSILST